MTLYNSLYTQLAAMGLEEWSIELSHLIDDRMALVKHGKMPDWVVALNALPDKPPTHVELKKSVDIGLAEDIKGVDRDQFISALKEFHPWRKGPYNLFGVDIDTEWRSDWKWDRVLPHIQSLRGRKVLDIGCGNGYHGWRMIGEGAEFVLGIDPTLISVMQFQVMNRYLNNKNHYVVPLGVEDIPAELSCFDTVFSMGVLYHRRSPLDHLLELKGTLRSGGELVLETLIIEGEENSVFMPEGRYAKMRNVWFLPSIETMTLWLRRCGFKNIACVNTNRTSLEEQRSTEWMEFESLSDFLDDKDHTKTIEGYPAPTRAIFTATKS